MQIWMVEMAVFQEQRRTSHLERIYRAQNADEAWSHLKSGYSTSAAFPVGYAYAYIKARAMKRELSRRTSEL